MQNELLEYNRVLLFQRLDKVRRKELDGCIYHVADLIDVLSDEPSRDKSYVSCFTDGEIVLSTAKTGNYTRNVRFFTLIGVKRYLIEGKIYAYANACAYFNIKPINLQHLLWKKQLAKCKAPGGYKTSALLKWLFGKRVSCKLLPDVTNIEDIQLVFNCADVADKLQFVIDG